MVVRSNLYGTVYSCIAAAKWMKEQRRGKIVTVSSYAGLVPGRGGGYAHYGAAKAAIAHYTRYLAQDLGQYGINVNCIAPGYIQTGRIAQLTDGTVVARNVALRRVGLPEDCANVIEFLVSEASSYVTGSVIPVDGGWRD
jgi:3-oxoacyl-[acyl-carrier protein] reductase